MKTVPVIVGFGIMNSSNETLIVPKLKMCSNNDYSRIDLRKII